MIKKRWAKSLIALMSASVLGLTGCTGCTGGKKNLTDTSVTSADVEKPAVAIAVADTANARTIASSAPIFQDTIVECAEKYGFVFITRIDGMSELVLDEDLDIDDQYKTASEQRLKADARSKATNILNTLDETTAKYPEVDFLEGIRISGTALNSLDDSYTSRTIIVSGTGLGTTGYMNFQNNLLSADPEVIVEMLKEREALPDLTGITVCWIGMGQVKDPQEKLPPKQLKKLVAIWKAVVEASGGDFVINEYITADDDTDQCDDKPEVSVVDIIPDDPIIFEPEILEEEPEEEPEEETASVFDEPVIIGEDQVKFQEDQAVYLNPEAAVDTIRPIAEYLKMHPGVQLLLIGSCAGDETNEHALQLSYERAEAMKNTLIELGVEGDRLSSIGMGCDDPWHIKNAGYDGPEASSNRKVVLIDVNTDTAQTILKNM